VAAFLPYLTLNSTALIFSLRVYICPSSITVWYGFALPPPVCNLETIKYTSLGRRAGLLGADALTGLSHLYEAVQMRGDCQKAESRSFFGMASGRQLGCWRCYTCYRAPSLFGIFLSRCKVLEDGRFSVFAGIVLQASAHSFWDWTKMLGNDTD